MEFMETTGHYHSQKQHVSVTLLSNQKYESLISLNDKNLKHVSIYACEAKKINIEWKHSELHV